MTNTFGRRSVARRIAIRVSPEQDIPKSMRRRMASAMLLSSRTLQELVASRYCGWPMFRFPLSVGVARLRRHWELVADCVLLDLTRQ